MLPCEGSSCFNWVQLCSNIIGFWMHLVIPWNWLESLNMVVTASKEPVWASQPVTGTVWASSQPVWKLWVKQFQHPGRTCWQPVWNLLLCEQVWTSFKPVTVNLPGFDLAVTSHFGSSQFQHPGWTGLNQFELVTASFNNQEELVWAIHNQFQQPNKQNQFELLTANMNHLLLSCTTTINTNWTSHSHNHWESRSHSDSGCLLHLLSGPRCAVATQWWSKGWNYIRLHWNCCFWLFYFWN